MLPNREIITIAVVVVLALLAIAFWQTEVAVTIDGIPLGTRCPKCEHDSARYAGNDIADGLVCGACGHRWGWNAKRPTAFYSTATAASPTGSSR